MNIKVKEWLKLTKDEKIKLLESRRNGEKRKFN